MSEIYGHFYSAKEQGWRTKRYKVVIMDRAIAHFRLEYLPISETFVYEYITHIKKFRSIVMTQELVNSHLFPFPDLYCAPSLRQYPLQWIRDRGIKKFFKRDLFFEDVIRDKCVRIIHAHFGPEGVRMLRIKNRLKLPLITTFYGCDVSVLARDAKRSKGYRELFNKGDLFLVEGSHMKRSLVKLGCSDEKIRIQRIAIDIGKYKYREHKALDKDKIIVLFCGRFIEKKGLVYALDAVKRAYKRFSNLEFRIIGDGGLRGKIEEYIKEQDMSRYVVLRGFQPHRDFLKELEEAHILLQPSVVAQNGDNEGGAPTVLLEAQAAGIPVVSTYHADIPEVVIDGETGFLVHERNPAALAEKIECLIKDPGLRLAMGRKGRRHIEENHNIDREVEKLETIYSSLLRTN